MKKKLSLGHEYDEFELARYNYILATIFGFFMIHVSDEFSERIFIAINLININNTK